MLFVSERSWKHHYVTLLLPYTYLSYRVGVAGLSPAVRKVLGVALAISAVMIASTSTEIGGYFLHHQGHKIAQAYGMFLWSGVILYVATAWRVRAEGKIEAVELGLGASPPEEPLRGPHASIAPIYRRERDATARIA
jgi:hypothetical protein